jgi:hypothetical protein
VFLQNYDVLGFFRICGIILLKKNPWNSFTAAWTGSTPLAHGAPNRNWFLVVGSWIQLLWKMAKIIPRSVLGFGGFLCFAVEIGANPAPIYRGSCSRGLGDELDLVSKTIPTQSGWRKSKGGKSVGAVDSRGRTTRRRFDRGPNTGVGSVLG